MHTAHFHNPYAQSTSTQVLVGWLMMYFSFDRLNHIIPYAKIVDDLIMHTFAYELMRNTSVWLSFCLFSIRILSPFNNINLNSNNDDNDVDVDAGNRNSGDDTTTKS